MTLYDAMPSDSTFDPNDVRTYGVKNWINVLHNATATKPNEPLYARAQQAKQAALSHIDDLHTLENHADELAASPGELGTFVQAAANELGLGIGNLISPEAAQYSRLGQAANPNASFWGSTVGMAGAMALGGGAGNVAARGAAEAIPALGRVPSLLRTAAGVGAGVGTTAGVRGATVQPEAVLGAQRRLAAGGITGVTAGAEAALTTGVLGLTGRGVAALLGKSIGKGSTLRASTSELLEAQLGRKPTDVELNATLKNIATKRLTQLGADPAAIQQAAEQAFPSDAPRPGTPAGLAPMKGSPIAESGAQAGQPRGFTAVGPPTPAAPSAPTAAEMQPNLSQMRAEYAKHTAESILPSGPTEPPATPQAGLGGSPGTQVVKAQPAQPGDLIRKAESSLGRAMTPQEKEMFLQRMYGAKRAAPGHPIWYGGVPPTREP